MDAPDLSQVTVQDAPDLSGPVPSQAPDLSAMAPTPDAPDLSSSGSAWDSFQTHMVKPITDAFKNLDSNSIPGAVAGTVTGLASTVDFLNQMNPIGLVKGIIQGQNMAPAAALQRSMDTGEKLGETSFPEYKKIMESPGGKAGALLSQGPLAPVGLGINWVSESNPTAGALLYGAAGLAGFAAGAKVGGDFYRPVEGEVLPAASGELHETPRLPAPETVVTKGKTYEGEYSKEPNDIVPQEISQAPDHTNTAVAPADPRSIAISNILEEAAENKNTGIEVNEGGTNPRTLDQGWIDDVVAKGKLENWSREKTADTILDHYRGTFAGEAIVKAQAIGTGRDTESTASRVTIMTHDQYQSMVNPLNLSQEPNWASVYSSIDGAVKSGKGLDALPELTVDQHPNGSWQVEGFDGRHRVDYLAQTGQHGVPVIIRDRTGGAFNRENPESIINATGKRVATPANLYPDQPKAVDPDSINPAAPRPNLEAIRPTKEMQANRLVREQFGGLGDLSVDEFRALYPFERFKTDMDSRIGFGTGSFRVATEATANMKDPTHISHLAWYLESKKHRMQEAAERKVAEGIHPISVAGRQYYNLHGGMSHFQDMYKTVINDFKAKLWFEQNPDKWFNGKDYFPTKTQLKDPNLSPNPMSEASANQAVADGLAWDRVFPDVAEVYHMKTGQTLTRVPGYLPHTSAGPWKVILYRNLPDGTRENRATLSARTEKARDNLATLLDKAKPQDNQHGVHKIDPTINSDLSDALHDVVTAKGKTEDPELQKILMEVYSKNAFQDFTQAMERQTEPQDLHDLARMVSEDQFKLTPSQARDAMLNYYRLMENIPVMAMRARYIRDVLFPVSQTPLFKNFPKFAKAEEEYMKSFLHISEQASSHIDNWVTDKMIQRGGDPQLPPRVMKQAQSWVAKYFLLWKPAFWVVGQAFQKYQATADLWTVKSQLLHLGETRGSVLKALVQDIYSDGHFIKLENGESLNDYVTRTGHANPQFIENIDRSGIFEDPVAKALDRFTRQGSATRAFLFFRQFLPERDALNAAMWHTDRDNVPYTAELGKNFFFNKEGEYLKWAGIFTQYSFQSFQKLSWQFQTLTRAMRSSSPMEAVNAATGVAGTMVAWMALAGLAGLPLAQNWNQIAEWFNKTFGTAWPTTKEWARDLGEFMRTQNFGDEVSNMAAKLGEFGVPSTFFGYDMASSGQGPSLQLPKVFINFITTIADASVLAAKYLSPTGVSRKELGQNLSALPSGLQASAEYALRDKDVADILRDIVSGAGEDAPNPHDVNLPGDYHRTPGDMIMGLMGLKSTGESAANTTLAIETRAQAVETAQVANLLQQIKEEPAGDRRADLQLTLLQKWHQDPEGVRDAIMKYQMDRNMTESQRRYMANDPSSLTSNAHMLRWLEENDLAPK